MELLQIEYFLAVARTENMTAAANSLHVAQSSVSRCITRLEKSLGVPLFEHSGRGIVLSDFGRTFYTRAESIMREISEGERELKDLRDQQLGRISISTSAARQINQLMIQALSENPDILFRQRRIADMNEVRAGLDSGMLDYALTYTPLPECDYDWKSLIVEKYYALMSASHPFAGRDTLKLLDLKDESLLLNDSDDPDYVTAACVKAGFEPRFSFIGNEFEVLGPMIEQGLGIALISTLGYYDMKKTLPLERLSLIRVVPIQDESFQRTLGVLSRKRRYMSPVAKSFYHKLLSYFKSMELNEL